METMPKYIVRNAHTGGWMVQQFDRNTGKIVTHGIYCSFESAYLALTGCRQAIAS